jgi:hypothetical protein
MHRLIEHPCCEIFYIFKGTLRYLQSVRGISIDNQLNLLLILIFKEKKSSDFSFVLVLVKKH